MSLTIIDIQDKWIIHFLNKSNWKCSDWNLLCHVTLYCEWHVYVSAPSLHLPNKVHGVILENSKFHIQPIVLSQISQPAKYILMAYSWKN